MRDRGNRVKPFHGILLFLIGCIATAACGGRAEEQGDAEEMQLQESAELLPDQKAEPTPVESLPMPEFPEPQRGYLVARGIGPQVLDGAWEAIASVCEDPPMVQVLARQPGIGTLIVLQLPPQGDRLTDYPVTIVEHGAPEGPASQVAVQLLRRSDLSAFQALDGEVSIHAFDDRISGRFAVLLDDVAGEDRQKYAGVFEEIPVEKTSADECRSVKAAMAQPDSAKSDSTLQ